MDESQIVAKSSVATSCMSDDTSPSHNRGTKDGRMTAAAAAAAEASSIMDRRLLARTSTMMYTLPTTLAVHAHSDVVISGNDLLRVAARRQSLLVGRNK